LLSQSDIKIPENPMIYSINEGNAKKWVDEGVWHYVEMKKEEGASLRYVGSMVKP
jgi:fructose-1,6-bisphosphatase